MKRSQPNRLLASLRSLIVAVLPVVGLSMSTGVATGQQLLLSNPHWNITLSDFGYSDYMLDNTPGFEGREYLSGEWAAAVAYQVSGQPAVTPQWLERYFTFPDWTNNSTFGVVTPLAQTGLNVDGLPIAQSVITNKDLEITLRHEMLDTVVGTPMGTRAASAGGGGTWVKSDRYVLKQTCTVKNISGSAMSNVQLFQFLHGLWSQRGVYDDRLYAGALSDFRYDVTQTGVDAAAVGAGSSSAGLEDIIGFHASVAPGAFEIGYYGIEGNGVDDHFMGKPSDGVHLSVEDNWQNAPYNMRQGTDDFAPPQRWVSGAQRWDLGNLAAGQSVSLDVLLSLLTGTRVPTGTNISGGCNGGASVPGGVDYQFDDVSADGSCFGEYSKADENEVTVRIAQGEFDAFTFLTPGGPAQLWELQFSGTCAGAVHLTFAYDAAILPPGIDQNMLCIYRFNGVAWEKLAGAVDPVNHTIAVTTTNLSAFVVGIESGTNFTVSASAAPLVGGSVTGDGTYADGSAATLVAIASAGYVFTNWTENGTAVSPSPGYTFSVHSNRTLVANFVSAGSDQTITTSALPSNGGSTVGDGAYGLGEIATVIATPNAEYIFPKWLEGESVVSTSSSYSFTVTSNRALVAKFKPVCTIITTVEPADGGEVSADTIFELGDLAVLKAKPNSGYAFVNWTQNGVQVSTETNYQFTVTGNRTLVAHFALGNRVTVSALPANGGTAIGGGVYAAGSNVTVIATAKPSYVFLNWTANGASVSTSPVYTFVSAHRDLVANFIAQPALNAELSAPGEMTLSWPAGASGWVLHESADLSPGSWTVSMLPVVVVDNQCRVTVTPLTGNRFFRLGHAN